MSSFLNIHTSHVNTLSRASRLSSSLPMLCVRDWYQEEEWGGRGHRPFCFVIPCAYRHCPVPPGSPFKGKIHDLYYNFLLSKRHKLVGTNANQPRTQRRIGIKNNPPKTLVMLYEQKPSIFHKNFLLFHTFWELLYLKIIPILSYHPLRIKVWLLAACSYPDMMCHPSCPCYAVC